MKKRLEDILFNGYVQNPIPMVFFGALVAVALIILAMWATIDSFRSIQVSSSAVEEVFVGYKYDGPIIELLTENGQKYDLPTDVVSDDAILEKLIKSSVPVWVEYTTPLNANEPSREVLALSTLDGLCLISHDVIAQARLEDKYSSLLILWVVCIVYISFTLTSYYFISHAPRFPRISSLLVRKPYRNF